MATNELTWKVTIDPAQAISGFQSLSREANASQKAIGSGELSLAQQLKAAEQLQRQRSAALIAEWKKQETAARNAAAGVIPFHQNLGILSGAIQDLSQHMNVFVGERIPLLGGAFVRVTENLHGLTSESEAAGGKLAALGGAAGVTALGLVAVGTAAAGIGAAVFEVVKKSAEAGLELQHLTEQTGLAAKTITSLKFAADESGKSIEGFDRGMKIFESTVAKAAEGSKEAEAALTRLGITPKQALEDLDGTLAAVFKKIYDAPSGVEKLSLASDAFGRRVGANIIPLIESFHGDLGELIKRAEELGVTLDEQGVNSLAEFQRNMNALGAQALGLERIFASDVAPTLTQFLRDLSKYLSENRQAFSQWGADVAAVLRGVREVADSELGTIVGWLARLGLILTGISPIVKGLGQLGASSGFPSSPDIQGGASSLFRTHGDLEDFVDAGGARARSSRAARPARAQRDTSAEDALREAQKQEDFNNALVDSYNKLEDELKGVSTTTKAYAVEQSILNGVLKDAPRTLQDIARENAALIETDEKHLSLKKALAEFTAKQNDEIAKLTKTERSYIDIASDFIQSEESQYAALNKTGTILTEKQRLLILLDASILQVNKDTEKAVKLLGSVTAQLPGPTGTVPQFSPEQIAQRAGSQADLAAGLPPAISLWHQLKDAVKSVKAEMVGFQDFAATTFHGVLLGITDAVRQSVAAWAIYGDSIGASLKKALAAILAQVAAEATIQALLHAAYAIGDLAFGNFAAAAQHAIAAAKFTAVAVAAGLSARAIAGSAFNAATSGTAGGASGSGSAGSVGSRSAGNSPASQDTNRVVYIQPQVHVTVVGQATEGFRYMVEKATAESVRLNGPMRRLQSGEDM